MGEKPISLDALASKPKVRILRYLATHSGRFTGREISLAARVEAKRASQALADLVDMGVVIRLPAGRAYLYSLNRRSYLVSKILVPAFQHEEGWLEALGRAVYRLGPKSIDAVLLYGSWARGQASRRSDVDLLVIVEAKDQKRRKATAKIVRDQLDKYRQELSERFGHSISVLVLDRGEVKRRLRENDKFIHEIIAQSKVLAGRPLSEVVASA
jgi:predicted nucleotidyltransferase